MKVSVRLTACAGEVVPGIGIDGRGEGNLAENVALAGTLCRLGVLKERPGRTRVNDRAVSGALRSDYRLAGADRLVSTPPIEGG